MIQANYYYQNKTGTMKKQVLLITIVFLLGSFYCHAQADATKIDFFLTKEMIGKDVANITLLSTFEYTNDGFVLLATEGTGDIFILGNGGFVPFMKIDTPISAFGLTNEGVLVAISGKQYGVFDAKSNFVPVCSLPHSNMALASNKAGVFVYDNVPNKDKKYNVYGLYEDKTYLNLLKTSSPITAVEGVSSGNFLYASEGRLFFANVKEQTTTPIFTAGEPIISIAVNPQNGAIFFASAKKIYHINGKAVEVFNDTFGGNLKFTADGLLTFQPEKHFMCRFRNNILQPK